MYMIVKYFCLLIKTMLYILDKMAMYLLKKYKMENINKLI
jgi:hypothetical protein